VKAYIPTKEQEAKRENLKKRLNLLRRMFEYYEEYGYIREPHKPRLEIEKEMVERIIFQLMITQEKLNKEFNK
jgi:hypothetical protein